MVLYTMYGVDGEWYYMLVDSRVDTQWFCMLVNSMIDRQWYCNACRLTSKIDGVW